MRVGIDLGPVVAGVIGRRGFACDLWGEPVNTAARVTGLAGPKEVVVTAALLPLLSKSCQGRARTVPSMKGKGPIELMHGLTASSELPRRP
ncbi:adenylate/guanylate cyclase domain-containing protein [Alsobacter sp. SYSU BS001988]